MKKIVILLAIVALVSPALAVPILGVYQMVPGADAWNYNAQLEMYLDSEGNGTTVRDMQIYGFADYDFGFGMTFYVDCFGGLIDENYTQIATTDTFDVIVNSFSLNVPENTKWSAVITGKFIDYPSTMYTINIAYDGVALNMGGTSNSLFLGGNAYTGAIEISSIPEPATMSLLALGFLGLIRRK